MNFKDSDLKVGSYLTVASAVALAGALGFIVFLRTGHGPNPKAHKGTTTKAQVQKGIAIAEAQKRRNEAKSELEKYVWTIPVEQVSAKTLNQVAGLTRKHKLTLIGSRPLKRIDSPEVIQLPWQILVEGPFPDVVAFEHDLEDASNRLAITLFQMSSGDSSTSKVTATIGVAAFVDPTANRAPSDQPNSEADSTSKPPTPKTSTK